MYKNILDIIGNDEYIRINALVYGIDVQDVIVQNSDVGVLPRVEVLIGKDKRHTIARLNKNSHVKYINNRIIIKNDEKTFSTVSIILQHSYINCGNHDRIIWKNGRTLVFDWVKYTCSNKCKFCFKEPEWIDYKKKIVHLTKSRRTELFNKNLELINRYILEKGIDSSLYDIVILCTASQDDPIIEREQHESLIRSLRSIGYDGLIYASMNPHKDTFFNKAKAIDIFKRFKDIGLDRINAGLEIANERYRKKYIRGFKSKLSSTAYYNYLEWATEIFGQNVGSCVIVGLEPHQYSIEALEQMSLRGIQSNPTIFSPFTEKQKNIHIFGDIYSFLDTSIRFKALITKYRIQVFNSVFGLV